MELIWAVGLEDRDLGPVERCEVLRALVMYEDAVVGNRALAMLNSVAREVEAPGWLVCGLWRFHFMADPSLLKMAAREAAAADIILIALPDGPELPAAVKKWIGLWLSTRNKQPKALVAFADEKAVGDCACLAVLSRLQKVARLGHMDFFATGGGTAAGAALQGALTRVLALHGREPVCPMGARYARATTGLAA